MDDIAGLVAKLERIEALYAGAATEGERVAAEEARRRIRTRIERAAAGEPAVELRFAIHNPWSRRLFTSLLRRYGLRPYRYPRQKRQTIMVRMPESAADELWREFTALDEALCGHLDQLATMIVARAISPDTSEAAEIREVEDYRAK
jgi:hypothetical protein